MNKQNLNFNIMKNRELNRAILRMVRIKLKSFFIKNVDTILYFLALATLIAILYFGYLIERNPEKKSYKKPSFIDVQNEPQSDVLDRIYYYDSLNCAYL